MRGRRSAGPITPEDEWRARGDAAWRQHWHGAEATDPVHADDLRLTKAELTARFGRCSFKHILHATAADLERSERAIARYNRRQSGPDRGDDV